MKIRKAFLISAFLMVSIIALLYDVDPQWFGRTFLNLRQVDSKLWKIDRCLLTERVGYQS